MASPAHPPVPQSEAYVSERLVDVHFSFQFSAFKRPAFPRCNSSPVSAFSRAQQMMRETKRSLIEIALEVGYTSPSAFPQVFRRVVGVTPTEFRAVR